MVADSDRKGLRSREVESQLLVVAGGGVRMKGLLEDCEVVLGVGGEDRRGGGRSRLVCVGVEEWIEVVFGIGWMLRLMWIVCLWTLHSLLSVTQGRAFVGYSGVGGNLGR